MYRPKASKKEAQGSGSSARASRRKGSHRKTRPLTPLLLHNRRGMATRKLSTSCGKKPGAGALLAHWLRLERLKTAEQWLRQEIRADRILSVNITRWGLTVLVGLWSFLYCVRRDVAERYRLEGQPLDNGVLPFQRWVVGTMSLVIIGMLFCSITAYVNKRLVRYRMQLINMKQRYSTIEETPPTIWIQYWHYVLFMAIPLTDVGIWLYFRHVVTLTIHW